MPFDVGGDDAIAVVPGDRVAATLVVTGGRTWIEGLRTLGAGEERPATVVAPADPLPGTPVPAFSLVNQDGRPLRLDAYRGKALLVTFVYTRCPGPCPILTGLHVDVQRKLPPALREKTQFVSISLDPVRARPKRYRAC